MSFGDVNLKEEKINAAPHNPGSGGWPTIRYFNKKTGLSGGSYVKKTDKAMCEELGDEEYMFSYIEDYGGTSLCSIETGSGCDERSKSYIEKMKKKPSEKVAAEFDRLKKMEDSDMKPELLTWLKKRIKILSQFKNQHDEL